MPIIHLKDLPEDVRRAVLLKQTELKVKKNTGMFSQKLAIITIIKEWMELKPKQVV